MSGSVRRVLLGGLVLLGVLGSSCGEGVDTVSPSDDAGTVTSPEANAAGDSSSPDGQDEVFAEYAALMAQQSGIEASVWACVVANTSLAEWVREFGTGALEDPALVLEVVDALLGVCDARDALAELNTEAVAAQGSLDVETASCISGAVFRSTDLDGVARYTATNLLVGYVMAEEVLGAYEFSESEVQTLGGLYRDCGAGTPGDSSRIVQALSESGHPGWLQVPDDEKVALANRLCELAGTTGSGSDLSVELFSESDSFGLNGEMTGNLLGAVWTTGYCEDERERAIIAEAVVAISDPLMSVRTFCEATDLDPAMVEQYTLTSYYDCTDAGTPIESFAETASTRDRVLFTFVGIASTCSTEAEVSYIYGEKWIATLHPEASAIGDEYRADLAHSLDGTWNTVTCSSFIDAIGAPLGSGTLFDAQYLDASEVELATLLGE